MWLLEHLGAATTLPQAGCVYPLPKRAHHALVSLHAVQELGHLTLPLAGEAALETGCEIWASFEGCCMEEGGGNAVDMMHCEWLHVRA